MYRKQVRLAACCVSDALEAVRRRRTTLAGAGLSATAAHDLRRAATGAEAATLAVLIARAWKVIGKHHIAGRNRRELS